MPFNDSSEELRQARYFVLGNICADCDAVIGLHIEKRRIGQYSRRPNKTVLYYITAKRKEYDLGNSLERKQKRKIYSSLARMLQPAKAFRRVEPLREYEEIAGVVANYYNFPVEIIYLITRRREILWPRQVLVYILREYLDLSFPKIARELGYTDHTSISHSHKKVQNLVSLREWTAREIASLVTHLEQVSPAFRFASHDHD